MIWFCAFSVWFRVFPFWLSLRFSLLEYRLLRVETNTNARERQVGGRWTGFAVGLRQPKEQRSMLVVCAMLSEALLRLACAFYASTFDHIWWCRRASRSVDSILNFAAYSKFCVVGQHVSLTRI